MKITNSDQQHNCDIATGSIFYKMGGLNYTVSLDFYIDDKFKPLNNLEVTLPSRNADYFFHFQNYNTGLTPNYYINSKFAFSGVKITLPTCHTATVSGDGNSVTKPDSTYIVNMGTYSAGKIKNGATPIPFTINLSDCIRIEGIEVKVTSATVGKNDKTLLANTLSGSSGVASGVGVRIEALPINGGSAKVLEPNNATSVFNVSETEIDQTDPLAVNGGIYNPDNKDIVGTTEALNFQATLMQDGNDTITAGQFKASSIFQITYP
ncbi:hypothetical protein EYW98_03445 [Escherichia coli]|uniref:fimbrial protein n=1 Tax=Escherichia sp. MOD1-EC7003 TaxID=2093900 RepID=UPI000CF76482|nr:fimbrial protein [Escherichia sp. MOD1-EC7003]EGO8358582.1 hypothetical protein [Escherichia coli]EGO8375921.1 hypothetical protein [Escherichia coli]MCH0693141.1 fimbrial protein [Escherichia coli]